MKENNNLDKKTLNELFQLLSNNIPIMLQNHARRNPSLVPKVRGLELSDSVLYSDEWIIVSVPNTPSVIGHVIVKAKNYSKIEEMPVEVAAHLFFVSSFVATALFESLGAHGTNIILHSEKNPDNAEGKCIVHVIARFQDDGLELIPKPLSEKPELKNTAEKIRSDRIYIPHQLKEARNRIQDKNKEDNNMDTNARTEIEKAIESLRKKT